MRAALIHRARLITSERGSRTDQGEYEQTPPDEGPWFRARLMERGGPAAEARRRPGPGSDARVSRGYELLAAPTDENGDPVVLTASSLVETDCPILGSPTIEMSTKPEKLNDGRRFIGWYGFSALPEDAS